MAPALGISGVPLFVMQVNKPQLPGIRSIVLDDEVNANNLASGSDTGIVIVLATVCEIMRSGINLLVETVRNTTAILCFDKNWIPLARNTIGLSASHTLRLAAGRKENWSCPVW